MKHNKQYWMALVFTGLLAACGGEDSPDGSNLGGLSSDGSIERAEASALVKQRSEIREPIDVNDLDLSKSETEEPFEI